MNGDIRFIVVRNKQGKIVARSLLRLLWDGEKGKPVLLQERNYSNVNSRNVEMAINQWAIQKAQSMGIPLVSKEVGEGEPYDGKVQFLKGGATFTYSDAAGGVMKDAFEVTECHVLSPLTHSAKINLVDS